MFTENKALSGGVIFLEPDSQFYGNDLTFQLNVASPSGGVIYLATGSYFWLFKSNFLYNTAKDSSVIYVVKSTDTSNLTIDKCTF